MVNGFEDLQKAGRESVARAMQSFNALSSGWQALANETLGFSRQAFDESAAHVEKLIGTRTLEGVVTAQAEFLKESYEKSVGQASRFGEIYMDVVKDVVRPFEDFAPTPR